MFDLPRLPYDLRPYLFEYLDRKTLLSACLASHAVNELASWSLYSSISVNPRRGHRNVTQPYAAFHRRPLLRNAVTEAHINYTLFWESVDQWKERGGLAMWQQCCEELQKLPRLTTIHITSTWGRNPSHKKAEEDPLFDAISAIPGLQRLYTTEIPYAYSEQLRHMSEIRMNGRVWDNTHFQKSPLNTRVTDLEIYFAAETSHHAIASNLSQFTALKRLVLNTARALPTNVCEALQSTPELRELKIDCVFARDATFERTGLKKLEKLKISMRWVADEEPIKVGQLVECVAGESNLRCLTIRNTRECQVEYSGDAWLPKILGKHRDSLVELRIIQFHPSFPVTSAIFGHSPHLEELWIGMNRQLRAALPSLVPQVRSLKKLTLGLQQDMEPWSFGNSTNPLFHCSKSLQVLNIYASGRERSRVYKSSWKAGWEYDAIDQRARRRILGPDEASVPSQRRGGDVTAHNEDYEYLYYDDAQYDAYSD